MAKTMKRIHSIKIKKEVDEMPNQHHSLEQEYIGIKAIAEVSFPLSEMHTAKCTEINDKRAQYACECSSQDSLIQHLSSSGLWGIESNSEPAYLAEIEQEQLYELARVLHQIGFSRRAIAAAMREVQHG